MYNPIEEKRRLVQERIAKSFGNGINVAEEIELEKAHKDGEMHPNGKWVWVSSANGGKGDWRTANGRAHKKHQETYGNKDDEGSEKKTLDGHAEETKTSTLKKVVASDKAPNNLKAAAKKELKSRGEDSGTNDTDNHEKKDQKFEAGDKIAKHFSMGAPTEDNERYACYSKTDKDGNKWSIKVSKEELGNYGNMVTISVIPKGKRKAKWGYNGYGVDKAIANWNKAYPNLK